MQFKLIVTTPSGTLDFFPTNWSNLCELRREQAKAGNETKSFVRRRNEGYWRPPMFSDPLY